MPHIGGYTEGLVPVYYTSRLAMPLDISKCRNNYML